MGTTPDALVPDCYLSLGIAVSLYNATTTKHNGGFDRSYFHMRLHTTAWDSKPKPLKSETRYMTTKPEPRTPKPGGVRREREREREREIARERERVCVRERERAPVADATTLNPQL